jgi:hypothetical protein
MPKTKRNHPVFYITENAVEPVVSYGSYTVMAFDPMELVDNEGNVYRTAHDLNKAGIRNDEQLMVMLDLDLLKFVHEPYFSIWEVGEEKPMDKKYNHLVRACRVAHAYAVSEPVGVDYATTN